MQLVLGIIRWLNIGTVTAACVVIMLMMLHITLDVGVRYFVNGQIVGTLEWVSFYYMVALVFLALGYVEYKNENIRVDLFAQMMPKTVQLALYVFACILGLVFFGMLFVGYAGMHRRIYNPFIYDFLKKLVPINNFITVLKGIMAVQ